MASLTSLVLQNSFLSYEEKSFVNTVPGFSNYEFVELITRLTGGGLAQPSQTVVSLLRNPWPTKPARNMM